MWLASRLTIAVASAVAAPGTDVSLRWDGGWYASIVAGGYRLAQDGVHHNVAFFPVYPALVWLAVRCGLPFSIAGPLIANIAFLVLVAVAFAWARERAGRAAAHWTVAALCFVPLSLFCSVAYAESTFMLCSFLALRAFERGRYAHAAAWGALASAGRFAGIALAPAFALATLLERRGPGALAAAVAVPLGTLAFSLYLGARFGDPIAYVHEEAAWRQGLGIDWAAWRDVASAPLAGQWAVQFALVAIAFVLAKRRARVDDPAAVAASTLVAGVEWRTWGLYPTIALCMGLGGALVAVARARLGTAAVAYTLLGLAMIVLAGTPTSADRYAYGLVPIAFGMGFGAARAPLAGAAGLIVCAVALAAAAARFAAGAWVG